MTWQPASVLFPDIELVLTGLYRAALDDDVYVSNSVPTTRRERMVIVRRDGGTQAEMRDRARVTIRVWALTEQAASDLAALVMALAPSFADGDPIISVPLDGRTGPYPVADESKQSLRAMSIEFHTRGESL